jgi:hypothetical protein
MQDPDPRLVQAVRTRLTNNAFVLHDPVPRAAVISCFEQRFVYADAAKAAGFQERQPLMRSTRIIQQKLSI